MRLALFLIGLGLVTGCTANDETAGSSTAAATEEAPAALDCSQLGSFPEAAMLGVGDGTYARANAAPNTLQSFTLGPLEDIPGWGGKHASYTRDVVAPCMDFVAIGDGSGLHENSPMPMTSAACAGQKGTITVLQDNPAIGAFLSFEDVSGLPFGKDIYFVTASQLDSSGKVSALCLANAGTGDRFLVTRQ